jgi:carbamate kinase
MNNPPHKIAVVALGGNAITAPGTPDTIANQFANTRRSLDGIVELIREGFRMVITHGNGPQVGNALLRIELSRGQAPDLPLGVLVADTEGGMGYMIEQSLQNRLKQEGIDIPVVTIITQMLVDEHDPAVKDPTKFIGQFYSKQQATEFSTSRQWVMKKDGDRGWRRVVPSPKPQRAIPSSMIKHLLSEGCIVIAGGGGGIPVYVDKDGKYEGFDAVIDKDLGSAVIARDIGADLLAILTEVDRVSVNFGKPNQTFLETVTVSAMRKHLADGQFPAGSMGPKIEAAIEFLERGGKMVTISSIRDAARAWHGQAGTRIIPD